MDTFDDITPFDYMSDEFDAQGNERPIADIKPRYSYAELKKEGLLPLATYGKTKAVHLSDNERAENTKRLLNKRKMLDQWGQKE